MIKITNLHKIYNKGKRNEHHALRGVDLEIGNTGLVCILGESGSGKTTLLNAIGGLDTYSEGSIELDEKEDFGYIFQNYYLLEDYSVFYNVKLALNRYDISEEEKEARVDYVLDMLGIAKYKKKLVSKLSGGQKQRVSIARALVKSPSIIFADEPTGNLDEENTIRTMSILKSISKSCLVLLVSHEKRIANFFADRIIEVRDGKIIRDVESSSTGSYTRVDDSNIYLKEYENKTLENNYAKFNLFYKGEIAEKVNFNIAFKDGKLYVQNLTPCDVIFAGEESGVELIDDMPPTVEMEDVEKLSYKLNPLPDKGHAKLSFKEIKRMAKENLRLLGKKQSFVIAIFLVEAILLTITLAQLVSTKAVDENKVVTSDSHYLNVKFEKVSSVRGEENQMKIYEFAQKYFHDSSLGEVLYTPTQNLFLKAKGVAQMENLTQIVNNCTYANIERISEKDIIYGRMPRGRREVVVDKRVLQGVMDSNRVVSSMYETMEEYLGIHLCMMTNDVELVIVGVSDTNEPNIYASKNALLGLESKGYNIASLTEYEALSGQTSGLKDDEILMREGLYYALYGEVPSGDEVIHEFGSEVMPGRKVVGLISDGYDIDFVGNDNFCADMRDFLIYNDKRAMVYAKDIDVTIEALRSYMNGYEKAFRLEITPLAREQVEQYLKRSTVDLNAINIISIIVAFVSLIMIYFTIKSSVIARTEELMVYHLLGISKASIIEAYILEMGAVTSLTSLPAVLLATGVIKFIGGIPSLKAALYFPWWMAVALVVMIYVAHFGAVLLTRPGSQGNARKTK